MKEDKEKKHTNNSLAAAASGAIIGAGSVVALQTVLKSKANQKKMREMIDNTKAKLSDSAENIKNKVLSEKYIKKLISSGKSTKRTLKKTVHKKTKRP